MALVCLSAFGIGLFSTSASIHLPALETEQTHQGNLVGILLLGIALFDIHRDVNTKFGDTGKRKPSIFYVA